MKPPVPARLSWFFASLCVLVTGCASAPESDPIVTLNTMSITGRAHHRAIAALEAWPDPETAEQALERVVIRDGYLVDVREAALAELARRDVARAMTALRRSLPQSSAWGWITRASQIIAERDWRDLTPALVSSWARPVLYVKDDLERPEYRALAAMHGGENVTDVVYHMFVESRGVAQQGLRSRCWELLHRLGQRERLVKLLAESDAPADDGMLLDLQAGARELGLVPHNREEILWLRRLREPQNAEFWSRAVAAVQRMSPDRRAGLEIRDLPIVVSASLHEPELLDAAPEELYRQVEQSLRGRRHYTHDSNYDGFAETSRQRLHEVREKLTWGDLAAMVIALRAVSVPQVVDHLFNYAARDRADDSTEYGGIIALDSRDRFEIREFVPVIRYHDNRFEASQAMLDAGYTSIFHFHLHVQNERNDKYAGPSFGDVNYADNTRANCLVFTSINRDTLNVDFYRHGRVIVDLGEVRRHER